MKNTYNWVVRIDPTLQKSVEKQIDEDLGKLGHIKPCHRGPALVSIISTDVVENAIKGNVRCQCRKEVATFSGTSSGSHLSYQLVTN